MINLLPPAVKSSILYARRNRRLRHWAVACLIVLIGCGLIIVFGYLYLDRAADQYARQVEASREQLKVQKLEETQKRVEDISGSVKLVIQVLSREVLFSKLLQQIGAVMPPNTALTNLQISKVQGGIDLSAGAIDYDTATQIQVNLQDPNNQIFEKADIVSINCSQNNQNQSAVRQYPCQVQIRALFAKDNPFLFINNAPTGTQP